MSANEPQRIVALAGGVGAARFLAGLTARVPPETVTAIINTGDDHSFYGVHVSPDLDIVTYTLAGAIDRERGFGLAGDTFELVTRLAALGHETWFRLGDRDYATCLHRTLRLRAGARLAEVTDELRRSFDVATRLLPMSEDPCPTFVELSGGRRTHFEEYLVRDGAPADVEGVDLRAARRAKAAPGVVEATANAHYLLVCPSNPVVSIDPILEVGGVREAIDSARAAGAPVVAISPIVGGAPIKGPADSLLRGIGVEVSARGVAAHYQSWIDAMVIDERDAALADPIRNELGLEVAVTDTIMVDRDASARLATQVLALAERLR
jgi:LPPG:FO 2-phospho-L-lactate transferase